MTASGKEDRGSAEPTDVELAQRCLRRERGAWEALVDRYANLVFAIARRAGLDVSACEDVVQEVCLLLLRNLHRIHDQKRLQGWVAKTARRESWRAQRRRRAAAMRDASTGRPEADPAPLPDEVLAEEERRHLVRRAVASLDGRCRGLLDALFLRGEADYRRLSAELDLPIGSIGPTRRRCLDRLIHVLEELGIPAPDVSGRGGSVSRKTGTRGSRKKGPA